VNREEPTLEDIEEESFVEVMLPEDDNIGNLDSNLRKSDAPLDVLIVVIHGVGDPIRGSTHAAGTDSSFRSSVKDFGETMQSVIDHELVRREEALDKGDPPLK